MKLLPKANDNSFVGNSALIFLTRFFPTLANTAIAIWFSHVLDTDVYGVYNNFWIRLFFVGTFATLGLQSFLVTYSPQVVATLIKKLSIKSYVWIAIWILLVATVFSYVQYNEGEWVMPFCFLCIYVLSVIVEAVMVAFRNLIMLISVNLIHTVLFCYVHYLFVNEGFSIDALFLYLLALATVKLLIYIVVIALGIADKTRNAIEIPDIKSIRNLWFHMGLYDVSQMLFRWVDKFVVATWFTVTASAIYFNGSVDIPFLPALLGAVASAALMQLSADKSDDAPLVIMNKSGRILSSIVFPVFFFLTLFRYEFIEFIFTDKYHDSVPIFLASIMVLPLRAYSFTVVLQNKHKGRIINTGVVIDLAIALSLMYPLYLLLGFPGIALSLTISTYIHAAYYLYHTAKVLEVPWTKLLPLRNWAVKLIVFALLFIGIHYIVLGHFSQRDTLILGGLFTVIAAGVSFIIELKATKNKYGNTTSTQA